MGKKITRSSLKSLVKECLVEILQEGLLNEVALSSNQKLEQPQKKRRPALVESLEPMRRKLDSEHYVGRDRKLSKDDPNVGWMTDDPVLQSVLQDTSKTTYGAMMEAERKGVNQMQSIADAAALTVAQSDPEDLFGEEAADKWNMLAFNV